MEAGEEGRIVVAGRPWLRYDPAQLCPCSSTSCWPQMVSVGLLNISERDPFLCHDRKRMESITTFSGTRIPRNRAHMRRPRGIFLASKARSWPSCYLRSLSDN